MDAYRRLMATVAILGIGQDLSTIYQKSKSNYDDPYKPCKNCGQPTTHRKQCCSGDCFRAYRNSSQ